MIATNKRDAMTTEEHCAWLDSLSDDEWMTVHMAPGYLCNLIIISQLKCALATSGMTVGERMELLEGLSTFADKFLTDEAVAAIEPACDIAIKMIHEAMALNTNEMWHLMGRFDVFSEFAKLNPSLLTAIRLCNRNLSMPARNKTSEMAAA